MLLKTLGHPALHRTEGALTEGLHRKDVALLVYLCMEGLSAHARGRLAALLWGESPEERARHSLTSALARLARVLPPGILSADRDTVRWTGGLQCDAVVLLRDSIEPEEVDDAFSLYGGHFLEGFDPGAGAEDFREWADRRRAELRNAALRLLERAGEQAEAAGAWARALRLGERAVEIDPLWEQGHRRIMRALAARGERNAALRHYQMFEAWLYEQVGVEPDLDTRTLVEQLRAAPPAQATPPSPYPEPLQEISSAGSRTKRDESPSDPESLAYDKFATRIDTSSKLSLIRTKIFISYCHEDAEWLARLQKHLRPLEREGALIWSDTRLKAGDRWREEIREALATTKVAVLLISADFLASDFIVTNELPPLLKAAEEEGATILPVIVSPCRFTRMESLSRFQAVNDPAKPLVQMGRGNREKVLDQVARAVEDALGR